MGKDNWQSDSVESERGYKLIKIAMIIFLANVMFIGLVIPLLIVIKLKSGSFGVLVATLLIWGYLFYVYANYLHRKNVVNKKISYALAVLMVIASFLY